MDKSHVKNQTSQTKVKDDVNKKPGEKSGEMSKGKSIFPGRKPETQQEGGKREPRKEPHQ